MQEQRAESGASSVEVYLHLMRNLQHEIQISIGAISRNNLGDFELSLWRQEMVCSRLKRLLASGNTLEADAESVNALNETAITMKSQADGYARLVDRCRRSTAILQGLCSLYGNASRGVFGANLKAFTCEG